MERDYPLYHNGNPISKPRKYHKKTFNVYIYLINLI